MRSFSVNHSTFHMHQSPEWPPGLGPAAFLHVVVLLGGRREEKGGYLFLFHIRWNIKQALISVRSSRIITLPPRRRNSLVLGINWPSVQ